MDMDTKLLIIISLLSIGIIFNALSIRDVKEQIKTEWVNNNLK